MRTAAAICAGIVIGLLAHSIAAAQSPPMGPGVGATEVWNSLITSGPLASLLGFILWRVDSERRQLQKERDALLERVLQGLNNATTSLSSIGSTNGAILESFNKLTEKFIVFMGGRGRGG